MVEYYVNDNYIDFFGKKCCAVMAKVQNKSLLVAETNHKENTELIAKMSQYLIGTISQGLK